MRVFDHVVTRALGTAIVVGLTVAVAFGFGLAVWLGRGATGAEAASWLVVPPAYLGAVALLANTGAARWLANEVDNGIALALLFVFVAIPFWICVYPLQLVAVRMRWAERAR